MKSVVSISLGASDQDYEFRPRFLGQQFHLRRFGADGDLDAALRLVARWRSEAEVIGLDLGRALERGGAGRSPEAVARKLTEAAETTPVTTGALLRTFSAEWVLRRVQREEHTLFTNSRTLFFSGASDLPSARTLCESTRNLCFADPLLQLGVPRLLRSLKELELYLAGAGLVRRCLPEAIGGGERRDGTAEARPGWVRSMLRRALREAHVVVGPMWRLEQQGKSELAGKTVITTAVTEQDLVRLRDLGVNVAVDRAPPLLERAVELDVLDALIVAALGKTPAQVTSDDYLRILEGGRLAPRVLFPRGPPRRVTRFAFVIHPLTRAHLKQAKGLDWVTRVIPKRFSSAFERLVAYSPPFLYSKVSGIKSPLGAEAEGWLITLGGTPRQLLAHRPEFTYRRLLAAAKMAEELGAQIMGLGAFTKVVGDAGVTVAKRARIPITTGNSYSASGALWAAQDAARRMGLLSVSPEGKVRGRAMVVGATGAIGSVCSRLLAMAFDEVHLVSPEVAKLLALKELILRDTPQARVHLSSRASENLREMDLIVSATSGAGKRVIDITKVKPGAIITDVARPLDLSPEDVAKRPDVLVIESGEILLPGQVRSKPIGLPPNVVYACLAETIVLALEGRFECFTVGRNIEWEKVKEIYKLGLKHGMRLAAICGVNGVYTDEHIQRVRALALQRRDAEPTPLPEGRSPAGATAASSSSSSSSGAGRATGSRARQAVARPP